MNDFVGFLAILACVFLTLSNYSIQKRLNRIEERQKVEVVHMTTVLRAVTSTQNNVRSRMKSDGVEPILDKPKAEQHYEQRGIKRVARGGKEDSASGEGTPARVGKVARRSYGGTSGTPGSR